MSVLLLAIVGLQGVNYGVKEVDLKRGEARALIERYGDCIILKRRKAASEAILSNAYSGVIRRKYPTLIDGKCLQAPRGMTAMVSFSGEHLKYALADALFEAELSQSAPPNVEAVPPLQRGSPYPAPKPPTANASKSIIADYQKASRNYDLWRASDVASQFGECVVRSNPLGARELLRTEPETAAESAAFGSLSGALGDCLAAGEKLTFSKQVLRGTVAINYYRLAKALTSPAQPTSLAE